MATKSHRVLVDAGVLAGLLFLLSAGALVTALSLPINQLTQPGGMVKLAPTGRILDIPRQAQGYEYTDTAGFFNPVWIHAPQLPAPLRLLTEAGPAVGTLAWSVGLFLVALVVRDINRGHAFSPRVPGRIALLALVLAVGEFGSRALEWWASDVVVGRLGIDNYAIPYFEVPLVAIFYVAMVLVLAEAFRQGRGMATELEGLV